MKLFGALNKFIRHYDVERSYQAFLDFSKHNKLLTLDIGCGDGRKTSIFRKLASEIIGLDVSLEKLGEARKRGIEVTLADAVHLPFRDNCFEAILCFHVIEHLRKSTKVLKEIRRILKSSGLLLLITPNRRRITNKIGLLFCGGKTGLRYPLNPDHVFEYDEKSLKSVIQSFSESYVIPLFVGLKLPSLSLNIEMKFPSFFKKYCDQWLLLARRNEILLRNESKDFA